MKKIIIFLITILAIFPKQAIAKSESFYEGEYINNIWMNKITPDRNTTYYQKARFFRNTLTNEAAYCIEPFKMFNKDSSYESTTTPDNLTNDQITRMKQLAYLGYNYNNRKGNEWYAVTQLLIWQTANPEGEYFFTEGLNGIKIDKYQSLIDELNNEVKIYNENPEFKKEYSITANEKIEIITNNTSNIIYKANNNYTKIEENKITIENLPIGTHEITITKEDINNNTPTIFYQSSDSQSLMSLGSIEPQEIKLKINVIETEIKIIKLDNDTNSTKTSGEATLEGTTFQLYDENMNKLEQIKIDKSSTAEIKNLQFGTYYLKEIIPGKGYELDNTTHKIEINETTPKVELNIKNKVIEGNLEIKKVYVNNKQNYPEPNIIFNIYNNKNELYTTIKTNDKGFATINLPYGTYRVEQANTTEGYDYIEPFAVTIKDTSTLTYNLTNYKIEGKLELNKVYVNNDDELPEPNIIFNIYDDKNELYTTIKTNDKGFATTNLPYGTYKIEQVNTTEGYDYVEPFTVTIKDTSTLTYNLTNYKIYVPNTYNENNNYYTFIQLLIKIIRKIIYANKNINTITIHS